MPIEPHELHAIKAEVANTLAGRLALPATVVSATLDAIDVGAGIASMRRVIMFDADTGDELLPSEGATGLIHERIAAQCLPGMPIELISKAYGDWLESDTDPRPFAVGKRVELTEMPYLHGAVTRRVETAGELHTLAVAWDDVEFRGEFLYSPSELREVTE